jgi:pimeloyl-ACP methyl ester carboxylesterase
MLAAHAGEVDMQTLELTDGRTLAWREYGATDGRPVFFFHGGNDSRLEAEILDEAAAARGVRLIATDRPGYGRSDFLEGRQLVDWPADVAELADHLKLDRFSVVGHSGGGPHALVTAARLPERVEHVTVVAGAAPKDAGGRGMAVPFRLNRFLAIWLPGTLGGFMKNHRASLDDPDKYLKQWGWASPADGRLFEADPELARHVVTEQIESYHQGVAAAVLENKMYYRDWGFALDDVQAPVSLIYGADDKMCPTAWGTYLDERLPQSTLHLVEGAGHISVLVDGLDLILE